MAKYGRWRWGHVLTGLESFIAHVGWKGGWGEGISTGQESRQLFD